MEQLRVEVPRDQLSTLNRVGWERLLYNGAVDKQVELVWPIIHMRPPE